MNLNHMNDEQIIKFISENLEKKRLSKSLKSEDLANKGGHGAQTYSNFVNKNTNIRLETFIQILRGLGELDKLQKFIEYSNPYSPMGNNKVLPKRVREKNQKTNNRPKWGDEQ